MPEGGGAVGALGPVGPQQRIGGAAPLVLDVPEADVHRARVHHAARRRELLFQSGDAPEGVARESGRGGGGTGAGADGCGIGSAFRRAAGA